MGTDTKTRLLEAMGARARAQREALGLTVNEMAVKMGRTYQCIYGMERTGIESLRVVLEWADALNMPASVLVFDTETRMRSLLESAVKAIDARTGPRKDLVRRIREEIGT